MHCFLGVFGVSTTPSQLYRSGEW